MATFITSKSVGQNIQIAVNTSTGYWKYQHNGVTSSVFGAGQQTITVANANGEFTLIPCLVNGTVSGDITSLQLNSIQLTSFDGTGLSGLTGLDLNGNNLTSLSGFTFPESLIQLSLMNNQLTSLSGITFPQNLASLQLYNNQLTEFDGANFPNLYNLGLGQNQLTEFYGTGLSSLGELELSTNQLTIFNGNGLVSLYSLWINENPLETFIGGNMGINYFEPSQWGITTLTTFDVSEMPNLTGLGLGGMQLTSLSGFTFPEILTFLDLSNNQLTSFDGTGLSSLTHLYLTNNQLTPQVNNSILNKFATYGLENGYFATSNGRTTVSEVDYQELIARGWQLEGLDLVVISSNKLRIKGVNTSR